MSNVRGVKSADLRKMVGAAGFEPTTLSPPSAGNTLKLQRYPGNRKVRAFLISLSFPLRMETRATYPTALRRAEIPSNIDDPKNVAHTLHMPAIKRTDEFFS
ncbi:hypothetical protein [Bradyrhizobium sp. SZCCHNRI1009]|uniref:hypothetical protein n=1 Tax=Bradyrhizobium sp. SZCCHNRI1009 TaxID=3057277 RepID=UPI002916CEFB|nr:hypothetical protein [Bradyrhizobium sp. SZCCHNRI1009]